jgi:hypothetical protein
MSGPQLPGCHDPDEHASAQDGYDGDGARATT